MIFYYSGCGNSRFVAKSIAETLGDELVFIPQADREGKIDFALKPGERLGFVFPIYSWRPPQLVLDFVERLRLTGAPSYTYMVVTYGDDAGMTEQVMAEALDRLGLKLDGAFGLTMPNTYVNMSFMNTDSPEVAQRKIDDSKQRLVGVKQAIVERKSVS